MFWAKKGDTFWQSTFVVLYEERLTYEMLSENIDRYKWSLLISQLFSDIGFIIEILRFNLLMKINFSIDYIEIFNIPLQTW